MAKWREPICPPCRGDCDQGRTCPARARREANDYRAFWRGVVLGGLLVGQVVWATFTFGVWL